MLENENWFARIFQRSVFKTFAKEIQTFLGIVFFAAARESDVNERVTFYIEILIVFHAEGIVISHRGSAVAGVPFVIAHNVITLHVVGN